MQLYLLSASFGLQECPNHAITLYFGHYRAKNLEFEKFIEEYNV